MREVPGFGMTKRDLDWYREGYSDAFSWVLRNLDLEPDDRDLVEKALEPLSRPGALSSEDAKEEVPPPCQEWVRLLRTVRGRFSAQFFHGARGMTGSSEGLGTAVSGEFGWMTWPLCSRAVSTYRNTSGRLAMLAHRVCFPHDPTTAWCAGGGREVSG